MKNIAVILAGGQGLRMGGTLPKQFLTLDGKSVIEHSLDTFDSMPEIDKILVAVHPDYVSLMEEIVLRQKRRKPLDIIKGGEERYLSSYNAVIAAAKAAGWDGDADERRHDNAEGCDMLDKVNLILHDAARPWITHEIVGRIVAALQECEAVAAGIRCTDTIWHCDGKASPQIAGIPPRDQMWQAQTPQAFRLHILLDAYRKALLDPSFHATDDCGVVLTYRPDVAIHVVEGSPDNKKITFANDLWH